MISVSDLVRTYGPVTAVGGISFEVAPGEVVGFLGPNGAGKTTTLKILSGFLEPTSGRVAVAGEDVSAAPVECRRRVGYLPENNPIYEEMEVVEYLEWGASVRGLRGPELRRSLQRAVERCGLGEVAGSDIGALSKGYRQRVGLAQAIVHDPPILLLDEPTSGLDPNQASEVRRLIGDLRSEKTVLLCTHILPEVQAMCDRVVIIHRGRIVAQGRPGELAAGRPRAVRVLLGPGAKDRAAEELSRLDGVASVDAGESDGGASFKLEAAAGAGDLRPLVFALAAERRWPLLELYEETASLEEVFRSLTT